MAPYPWVTLTLTFPPGLSVEVVNDRLGLISEGRLTLAQADAFVHSWDTRGVTK